jgi:hypothetical protein
MICRSHSNDGPGPTSFFEGAMRISTPRRRSDHCGPFAGLIRYLIPFLIPCVFALAACFAGPAPAVAFPAAPRLQADQPGSSLLLRIMVICKQERIGNTIHTGYCPDGYLCRRKTDKEKADGKTDAEFKCEPGPEVRRQQQKKAEEEWARSHKLEVERGHAETERDLQQLERRSREQTDADKIVPTLPQGSRIRMGLPGTQYKQPVQSNPTQDGSRPGASASGGGGTNPGAAVGAAINAAGNALNPRAAEPPPAVTSAPRSYGSEPTVATAPNPPQPMSGASAPAPSSATGPQLLPGLTKQECTARGGRIITYTNTAGVGPDVGECFVPANIAAGGANATRAPRHTEPRRFTGKPAPDIRQEVRALSEALAAMPDDSPDRPRLLRNLMRLMADNRVRMTPEDMACLQSVSRTGPKQIDLPLRWHPYHIKKEAIDRSGLCNGTPEGDAKDACREENYGRAVMWAEPECTLPIGFCTTQGSRRDRRWVEPALV